MTYPIEFNGVRKELEAKVTVSLLNELFGKINPTVIQINDQTIWSHNKELGSSDLLLAHRGGPSEITLHIQNLAITLPDESRVIIFSDELQAGQYVNVQIKPAETNDNISIQAQPKEGNLQLFNFL